LCIVSIPFDPFINSSIILIYNIISVALVAIYAAVSFFISRYIPAGYFLIAFFVPILVSVLIVLDFLTVFSVSGLNVLAGFAFLVQSIILFVGVVTRYEKMNEDLMRVTLTKWQKEHEAKLFQLENTALLSQNEIIGKQKTQLTDQARRLEEMNAAKDKLLSVLSHDLRAPVNNLRAILKLLSDRLMSPEEFHGLSDKLKKDVEGVYEMLEDVLQWAKSQHEGIIPRPVNFDLKTLIDEVVQLAAPLASEKQISIDVICTARKNVKADPDHVHIIMRNLISNAIKFARTGTVVKVVLTHQNGDTVVSITDEGVGIGEEDTAKIMSGMKVNSTRGTGGEKGTGLGLLLCREFIELNGGQFSLQSKVGKGTTVSFTLPDATQ
jgi:signal transduction histidine kinase